jgi:hypothetical protein
LLLAESLRISALGRKPYQVERVRNFHHFGMYKQLNYNLLFIVLLNCDDPLQLTASGPKQTLRVFVEFLIFELLKFR